MTTAQAPSAIAVLQEAADALDATARHHKRLEALHRRSAREARQRLAKLEAASRALGIRLVIHPGHSPDGGTDR